VQRFAVDLDRELARLRDDMLGGRSLLGEWTEFRVFDPKPRRILAPCFRDRVMHHALMAHMGPVLDRALAPDTFACRVGKGTHAAVRRAQRHLRAHPWYVKVDVRGHFASVDHGILRDVLARRFKHPELLGLCARALARTPDGPGRGLPIGALTSQHFANSYLDALDRHLLQELRVGGTVRYMDDVVWWCPTRERARETLAAARAFLLRERALVLKPDARVGRSEDGLSSLGFRVGQGRLGLSLRRGARDHRPRRCGSLAPRRAPPPSTAGRVTVGCGRCTTRYRSMGSNRVHRGGSWNNHDAQNLRAANRNANPPGDRNDNLGFRLARAQTPRRSAAS